MKAQLKEALRQIKVAWALSGIPTYPQELPNPPLGLIDERQAAIIDGLESVCLFLGPYRNLTTLTASMLSLHPECQVLNHAGTRVFPNKNLNFIEEYSVERYRMFCHFALRMSQGGTRGGYGGSILLAHAFAERPQMRRLYTARYGFRLLKQNVKCLAWKESERINRVIREKSVDLGKLVKKNKTLRFLHPIRNPLDCSVSIVRTGMMPKFYPQLKENDLPSLVELILGEIRDFLDLAQRHPDHFFFYFQDDLKESVLNELAKFLGLSDDQRWVKDSMKMYQLRRPYKHEPTLKEHYRRKVDLLFKDYPDVKDHLLKMATNHE